MEDLKSQVLITSVTLKAIKGKKITLFLSHFGEKKDLKNLLNMNAKFDANKFSDRGYNLI